MKKLFSHRHEKQRQKVLQVESLDTETRTRLWSVFHTVIWKGSLEPDIFGEYGLSSFARRTFADIWDCYFKLSADTFSLSEFESSIRRRIADDWYYNVFDIFELLHEYFGRVGPGPRQQAEQMTRALNRVLEEEAANWRMVKGLFMPAIADAELDAVENALDESSPDAAGHLRSAIQHLRNKPPQYGKSIAESVHALEATCRGLTQTNDAWSVVWPRVCKQLDLHPLVQKQVASLFDWASDLSGSRHSAKPKAKANQIATFRGALFTLVSASGAINLVLERAEETAKEDTA